MANSYNTTLMTAFIDDTARLTLITRVPGHAANTGLSYGGSNSPGIGISTQNPNLAESLPSWTLLDQHGNARTAQIGQMIGGLGVSNAGTSSGTEGTQPESVIRMATSPANVNGNPDNDAIHTFTGNATLADLAVGWTEV